MAEVGFDKDVAVATAGALAEQVNERFGDSIPPSACAEGVKQFIKSGVDLKCRSCGWRKLRSNFCTQRTCDTLDGDTCNLFRHLFVVK